jgi:hypothetical protein
MGSDGIALATAAKQAFVDGMGVAFLVSAVVIAAGAVLARKFLPAEVEEADHAPVGESRAAQDSLVSDASVSPRVILRDAEG